MCMYITLSYHQHADTHPQKVEPATIGQPSQGVAGKGKRERKASGEQIKTGEDLFLARLLPSNTSVKIYRIKS